MLGNWKNRRGNRREVSPVLGLKGKGLGWSWLISLVGLIAECLSLSYCMYRMSYIQLYYSKLPILAPICWYFRKSVNLPSYCLWSPWNLIDGSDGVHFWSTSDCLASRWLSGFGGSLAALCWLVVGCAPTLGCSALGQSILLCLDSLDFLQSTGPAYSGQYSHMHKLPKPTSWRNSPRRPNVNNYIARIFSRDWMSAWEDCPWIPAKPPGQHGEDITCDRYYSASKSKGIQQTEAP